MAQDYLSVITPNTDLTVADFDGRGPGTSTNLSTGDIRRKYNFGDRVSELAIAQDPFFRFCQKQEKSLPTIHNSNGLKKEVHGISDMLM